MGLFGKRLSLYEASPQRLGKMAVFSNVQTPIQSVRKMKKQRNIVQIKEQQQQQQKSTKADPKEMNLY